MHIKSILPPLPLLKEALRVTNKDRKGFDNIKQHFKIGIEYEFLVNDMDTFEDDSDELSDHYAEQARENALENTKDVIKDSDISFFLHHLAAKNEQKHILHYARKIAKYPNSFPNDAFAEMASDVFGDIVEVGQSEDVEGVEEALDRILQALEDDYHFDASDMDDELVALISRSDEYQIELDTRAERELGEIIDHHREHLSNNGDLNERATEHIEGVIDKYVDSDMIHHVITDGSLRGGTEVVTKPLQFDQAMEVMDSVFEMISDEGHTDDTCGMHVNISHKVFEEDTRPNLLRVLALMDTDFFQNVRGAVKSKLKYPPRSNMTAPISIYLSSYVLNLAFAYSKGGFKAMEVQLKELMDKSGIVRKHASVNWLSYFDIDPNTRRIEFRFFGGAGYETRANELEQDIKYIMHVIHTVVVGGYDDTVYMKGVIKLLDQSAKRYGGFSRLTAEAHKHQDIEAFKKAIVNPGPQI